MNLRAIVFGLIGLCLAAVPAQAQMWFRPGTLPVQGLPPGLAGAGGFNAPQFSAADLDGDGTAELAAFDRAGSSWQVFRRVGSQWVAAPDYAALLPATNNWALLRDYNRDGRADLFTDTRGGVALYRNEVGPNGGPFFTLAYDGLVSTSLAGGPLPMYVLMTDIPSIVDVDNDGDLDILTFENAGGTLDLHRNLSNENPNAAPDPVRYRKEPCYGRVFESATCGQYTFNINCRLGAEGEAPAPTPPGPRPSPNRPMHAGSTTLALDLQGNGKLDLLLGDVSCKQLYRLVNGAPLGQPSAITAVEGDFPAGTRAARFDVFPAAFTADIDGDGRQDLLAAPNLYASGPTETPNFARCVWAYRNTAPAGAPSYQFATAGFLQTEMVDLGANASPTWLDLDADGDQDLVVASRDRMQPDGTLRTGLTWYRREAQGLVLADTNLLGYLALRANELVPFAGDFNGDGRADLGLLVQRAFNRSVGLVLPVGNTVGADGTALQRARQDSLRFAFLPGDYPAFADFDLDGDPDMVLGRDDGSLNLVTNTGSAANPQWGPRTSGYLRYPPGINVACKPALADVDGNGQPDLLVTMGNLPTRLYRNPIYMLGYTALPDTLLYQNNTFQQADLLPTVFFQAPSFTDLNGDGRQDLVLGTGNGGLIVYENQLNQPLATAATPARPQPHLLGNPGPSLGLGLPQPARIRITDGLGRQLYSGDWAAGAHPARWPAPAPGLYLVEVSGLWGRTVLRYLAL